MIIQTTPDIRIAKVKPRRRHTSRPESALLAGQRRRQLRVYELVPVRQLRVPARIAEGDVLLRCLLRRACAGWKVCGCGAGWPVHAGEYTGVLWSGVLLDTEWLAPKIR